MEERLYNIILYTTDRGDSPIDEFLDVLDKKSRAKVAAICRSWSTKGRILSDPMRMWSEEKSGN
jgi:hypothetical protein